MNMNKEHVSLLVLLDLSATFDTVDHGILISGLQTTLGVWGTALWWFISYLTGRSQRVSVNETLSKNFEVNWGVSQGSCLGPLFFIIYASKFLEIIESHLTYTLMPTTPSSTSPSVRTTVVVRRTALAAIERCINDMRSWMLEDKLMLDDDKTECVLVGTCQQLAKVSISSIKVGETCIPPDCAVRNLGAWFDSKLTMDTHVTKTCSAAFFIFIIH